MRYETRMMAGTAAKTAPRRHVRRKRRRLRSFVRCALTMSVLIVVAAGGIRLAGWVRTLFEQERTAADWQTQHVAVADGTAEAIAALAVRDGRAKEIARHPENYPAAFLDALAKNEEMLDFVLGFPAHSGDAPAESLNESLDTVPLLLQWDARWGYQTYGESTVAVSGCAPTCVAMVASHLTGDAKITPYAVAQYAAQQGYYVAGTGTSWDLIHTGVQHFGVASDELPLGEAQINAALDAGQPVICSMLPGDFTTTGHFIVLYARADGGYRVRDPFSRERSEKIWSYDTLSGQIGNLWACRRL